MRWAIALAVDKLRGVIVEGLLARLSLAAQFSCSSAVTAFYVRTPPTITRAPANRRTAESTESPALSGVLRGFQFLFEGWRMTGASDFLSPFDSFHQLQIS
jgi:hypothetical protein